MSTEHNNQHNKRILKQDVGVGRVALLFLLTGLACLLGYNAFFADASSAGVTSIPKAMKLNYMPADFKINLDDAKTLEILSNPQRYKEEFDALIYNFNMALLMHVATRMGLDDQTKALAAAEYKKQHPYIRQMYFNDFIGLKDTTSHLYQSWYENESGNAVDLMNEVASKYTCFFINNILGTILKTQDGNLSVKGNKVETPCGVALTEGLHPLIKRLKDGAAIRDFSRAKGLMKEKVEKAITELGVMEVRDRKGINQQFSTKLFSKSISTTEVQISAISILKVGFKLDQYFNITVDESTRSIIVTLPQPTIISHEVFPKVDNLDVGWMREVNADDLNKSINALRQQFREDALNSDIFLKSKSRASEIMSMILGPMIKDIGKNFQLKVRFVQPDNLDYNLPQQTAPPKESPSPQPIVPPLTRPQPNTKQ